MSDSKQERIITPDNDLLSSRESTPVQQLDLNKGNDVVVTPTRSKPRIFQKLVRESSFGAIKSEEKCLGSSVQTCSIETQTEWSWTEDIELVCNLRKALTVAEWKILIAKVDNSLLLKKTKEAEVKANQKVQMESSSSDEDSDEEELHSIESPQPKVESIGPPKILQFKPEIKEAIELEAPSPVFSIPTEPVESVSQFMHGFNVHVQGGDKCEFCEGITKPWPSIEEQNEFSPEEIYCCNDYQEYVDGLIKYQSEKEKVLSTDDGLGRTKATTTKASSGGNTNPQASRLVKDRDEHKNMQRLLDRQKRLEELAAKKQEQLQQKQQKEYSRNADVNTPSKSVGNNNTANNTNTNNATNSSSNKDKSDLAAQTNMLNNPGLANQMKSINYQLSNLKCLQDGWTVRPKSPIKFSNEEDEDDEMNLLTSSSKQELPFKRTSFEFDKRIFEKPLMMKKYRDGSDCLILFPDGSGNVFYPSGRLALSISLVSPGMHIITAYSDDQTLPVQIAQFDPYGNGSCNYNNGKTRLILTSSGGLELDANGIRKKKWQWQEVHNNHVHAPPFQSIQYILNNQLSVKLVSQEKINVDFVADSQMCKFRINIKPKHVLSLKAMAANENSLAKLVSVEHYLGKKRSRIEELFSLMNQEDSSILKLPKIIGALSKDLLASKLSTDVIRTNKMNKNRRRKDSSKFLVV